PPRAAATGPPAAAAPNPQRPGPTPPAGPTLDAPILPAPAADAKDKPDKPDKPDDSDKKNGTIELSLADVEEASEKTRLSLAPTASQEPEPATDPAPVTAEPTQID